MSVRTELETDVATPYKESVHQTPYLFELSGEHPLLPSAEVMGCCYAECESHSILSSGPGYIIIDMPEGAVQPIGSRIALTHRIGEYLLSCEPTEAIKAVADLKLPDGTFAVRVGRKGSNFPEIDCNQFASDIGHVLAKDRKVDLFEPETELRVMLSDRIHFYIIRHEVDRSGFEERKVAKRPFFSPISLHPRYARALVNLTGVKRGERLLDPFCGTGGILIEAGMIGVRPVGSDISETMIEGCKENMDYFGLKWDELVETDIDSIDDVFDNISVVATDPPYGRSASTRKEPIDELYSRAISAIYRVLRSGGRAGIVLPRPCISGFSGMKLRESIQQRVHRSLTRHYCLLDRL
ncbi:MAG: DNA modification methylase [Euryarchaeota archaeon]|nr:DNA modification methylase [Euryarchaeota archaeon]